MLLPVGPNLQHEKTEHQWSQEQNGFLSAPVVFTEGMVYFCLLTGFGGIFSRERFLLKSFTSRMTETGSAARTHKSLLHSCKLCRRLMSHVERKVQQQKAAALENPKMKKRLVIWPFDLIYFLFLIGPVYDPEIVESDLIQQRLKIKSESDKCFFSAQIVFQNLPMLVSISSRTFQTGVEYIYSSNWFVAPAPSWFHCITLRTI